MKLAWAEGRVVAPSLSEVAAYLSSPCEQQPQEVAGAKRAAASDPVSPPASGDDAAIVPKGAVAPSPKVRRRACLVCGYLPATCVLRGCGASLSASPRKKTARARNKACLVREGGLSLSSKEPCAACGPS